MDEVPHLVIGLGFGAFGVGAGTFNDLPAVAMIPAQDAKVHEIGEDFSPTEITEMLPGTVVIAFKDPAAIERHIELLRQLHSHWEPRP